MIRKKLIQSKLNLKNYLYSGILFDSSNLMKKIKMGSIIEFQLNRFKVKLNVLNIHAVNIIFRNFLPLFFSFIKKKNKKILIIGNRTDTASLLNHYFSEVFNSNVVIYKKEWIDGFLTNKGEYRSIQLSKYSTNNFTIKKGVLNFTQKINEFSFIILLNEIENRELEILQSMFIRRIPIISLSNTTDQLVKYTYSTYSFILDIKELNSYFFFLTFLKDNYILFTEKRKKNEK